MICHLQGLFFAKYPRVGISCSAICSYLCTRKLKKQKIMTKTILWIAALVVGAVLGVLGFSWLNTTMDFIATVYTRLFQLLAVPTIVLAVITTFATFGSKGSGRIFGRTLTYTLFTTFAAAAVGAVLSPITWTTILLWILISVISAVGNAGVPMGCYFLTLSLMSGIGAPVAILGVILPIYTIIDMVETAENVWSDSCVAAIVDRDL